MGDCGEADVAIKFPIQVVGGKDYVLHIHTDTLEGGGLAVVDPVLSVDPSNPNVTLEIGAPLNVNNESLFGPDDAPTLAASGFNLDRLKKVGIQIPSTIPTLVTTAVATPAASSFGWNNTNVIVVLTAAESGGPGVKAISFSLTGAQAGSGTAAGSSTSVTISVEGLTTLTYFSQDNAGNQESPKTLVVQIDKTPPVVGATVTPPPNVNGWNSTDVTVRFTAIDALSGVASVSSPVTLTAEGEGQAVIGAATDRAGNSASTRVVVNIDKTPPTVACVRVPRQKREDDEGHGKQLFQVTASDTLSGVTTITLGDVQLTNAEIIQIQQTRRPGVRLVVKTDDDDDRDEPRIRRFRVGPGADLIRATDNAGNVGTAVCPLPPRRDDDDTGREHERGRGHERARSDS